MNPLGGYQYDVAKKIYERVLGQSFSQKPVDASKQQTVHNDSYYVLLLEDLPAATNHLTGYSQADCRIVRYLQPVQSDSLNMELAANNVYTNITVTNRNVNFSAATGDLLFVIRFGAEWVPLLPQESSGTKIISFSITSSDPTIRSALVEIRQRSFTGTVYGSILDDSVVTVYDTDGCFLNEPNVDLTGRNGKAVLMYVDAEAEAVHFTDYTVPTKYWNVISLCCPNTVCE